MENEENFNTKELFFIELIDLIDTELGIFDYKWKMSVFARFGQLFDNFVINFFTKDSTEFLLEDNSTKSKKPLDIVLYFYNLDGEVDSFGVGYWSNFKYIDILDSFCFKFCELKTKISQSNSLENFIMGKLKSPINLDELSKEILSSGLIKPENKSETKEPKIIKLQELIEKIIENAVIKNFEKRGSNK